MYRLEDAPPSRTARSPLCVDAALNQDALGAVVPDIHFRDLAVPHHETIDIAIDLEWCPILPFAVQRPDAVDDGRALAGTYVEPDYLLLDPAVPLGIEAGRPTRVIELASAREGDDRARGHI